MRYITSHWSEWPSSKNLQTINAREDLLEKKRTLFHWWWKCKLIQALQRTVWRFLKNLKITTWASNATLRHIPWGHQNWERHVYAKVHSSTIYNSQDMEASWTSIDRWMDKDVVRIHSGILCSHKRYKTGSCAGIAERWDGLPVLTAVSH